eukprot:678442-Amphidinium_carterae.1
MSVDASSTLRRSPDIGNSGGGETSSADLNSFRSLGRILCSRSKLGSSTISVPPCMRQGPCLDVSSFVWKSKNRVGTVAFTIYASMREPPPLRIS